jgi:hypothetical protein
MPPLHEENIIIIISSSSSSSSSKTQVVLQMVASQELCMGEVAVQHPWLHARRNCHLTSTVSTRKQDKEPGAII